MFKEITQVIKSENRDLWGLYISHKGKAFYEEYFKDKTENSIQQIYSCSKAISSLMIGQALEQNPQYQIHTKLAEFFPEYNLLQSERGQEITLEHFLNQTSGIKWIETGRPWDANNSLWQMEHSEHWMEFLFSQVLTAVPGIQFNYNTGVSNALGYLIERISGIHPLDFYHKYFAQPLQIEDSFWKLDPQGYPQTGKGLHLKLRDLAHIGQMVLDFGEFAGRRILNAPWIEQSLSYHSRGHNYYGSYGFQWWLRKEKNGPGEGLDFNVKCAIGHGGNFIFLVPEWELLVATTGHLIGAENFEFPQVIFREHILPLFKKFYT